MDNFFYELSCTSTLHDLLRHKIDCNHESYRKLHGFDLLDLPVSLFKDESKLFSMIEEFDGSPLIIKMNPMTFYNWHTDIGRNCAVNMLIENVESHCIFTEKIDANSRSSRSIVELVYKPLKYYLFNTQIEHSVLNFKKPRYLLSITFKEKNYNELLDYCKKNDL